MTFAYQILSMTNYCNLRCTYCDWEKTGGFQLSPQQLENARGNIRWSREFADANFSDFLMGVYSGGEPFVFPELVEMFLDTYADKWVRISTNGLLDAKRCMPMLARHEKLILTASLDGMDLQSNRARFTSNEQLYRVLCNIQEALEQGILVMVLCTINRFNIDHFFDSADELYQAFRPYVDRGQLVMPAHYITAYTTPVGLPNREQSQRFLQRLEERMDTNPLLSKVDWHYQRLAQYVRTKDHSDCCVCDWSRCAHFLEDRMVGEGIVNTYLCPMRGYGDLGEFPKQKLSEEYAQLYPREYEKVYGAGKSCRCFVDWTAFDLVLQDLVSLERAGEWFAFFRDPEVRDWIIRYRQCNYGGK